MNIDKQILDFMKKSDYRPMKRHDLAKELNITDQTQRKQLRRILLELENKGLVTCLRKNRWGLKENRSLIKGKINILPNGNGLVISSEKYEDKIFISRKNTGLAFSGDIVEVERYFIESSAIKSEGRVTQVLKRNINQVVGNVKQTKYYKYINVENITFPDIVKITNPEMAEKNHKVVLELDNWDDPYQPITGKIIEDLGKETKPGIEIDSILRSSNVSETFPKSVLDEVKEISSIITEEDLSNRKDHRNDLTFTIDPDTAQDYDDAISIEPHFNSGWILGVHIADVSHYVTPGSKLDNEALKRGNSIYLVDRVVMMLPKELTTEICSLNPNCDSLSHSVFIHLNDDGEIIDSHTYSSVIHSKARLTYRQVQKFLNGSKNHQIPDDIQKKINLVNTIITKVRNRRMINGSLEINTPDLDLKLDDKKNVIDISTRSESKEAYQLIEDCMLLANRVVAEKLTCSDSRANVFRVHEEPDDEQWKRMATELEAIGINIIPSNRDDINSIFYNVKNTSTEYSTILAILKNLKRAEYCPEEIGHFGLAFDKYTHFTSPIRRYADLVVHRLLKAIEKHTPPILSKAEIEQICIHCTETEKKADSIEKKSIERKRLEYYQNLLRKGKDCTLNGYIVGIKKRGIVIELPKTLLRGMVSFNAIKNDYYEADITLTRVINNNGSTIFKLGDSVEVMIEKISMDAGYVDFIFTENIPTNYKKRKPKLQPDQRTGSFKYHSKRRKKKKR